MSPSEIVLGREGEHNFTVLEVNLDPNLADVDYYRICFDDFYSVDLTAENGKITYTVPNSALKAGVVPLQIDGYKFSDGEDPIMIFKSTPVRAEVLRSIDSKRSLPEGASVPLESAVTLLKKLTDGASDLKNSVYSARDNASTYCENANTYAENAQTSANSAKLYAENAQRSYEQTLPLANAAVNAEIFAANAKESENACSAYCTAAKEYKTDAKDSAAAAGLSENKCSASEINAKKYCEQSLEYSKNAQNAVHTVSDKADTELIERNFALSQNKIVYNKTGDWESGSEYISELKETCAYKRALCEYAFVDGKYRILFNCTHSEEDEQKVAPQLIFSVKNANNTYTYKNYIVPLTVRWGYAYADIETVGFLNPLRERNIYLYITAQNDEIPLELNGSTVIYDYKTYSDRLKNLLGKNISNITIPLLSENCVDETDESGNSIAMVFDCDVTLCGEYNVYLFDALQSIDGSEIPTMQFLCDGNVVASAKCYEYNGDFAAYFDCENGVKAEKFRVLFAEEDPIILGFPQGFDGALLIQSVSVPEKANRAEVYTKNQTAEIVNAQITAATADSATKEYVNATVETAIVSAITETLNKEV